MLRPGNLKLESGNLDTTINPKMDFFFFSPILTCLSAFVERRCAVISPLTKTKLRECPHFNSRCRDPAAPSRSAEPSKF